MYYTREPIDTTYEKDIHGTNRQFNKWEKLFKMLWKRAVLWRIGKIRTGLESGAQKWLLWGGNAYTGIWRMKKRQLWLVSKCEHFEKRRHTRPCGDKAQLLLGVERWLVELGSIWVNLSSMLPSHRNTHTLKHLLLSLWLTNNPTPKLS